MFKDQIDTQKGIAYMAGKKEVYVKIVNSFLRQMETKIENLNQFLTAGDFERLVIEFHGLKSSAASLGSTALPPFALELEIAGKEANNELIKEKYAAFIDQYKDTCGALEEAITAL